MFKTLKAIFFKKANNDSNIVVAEKNEDFISASKEELQRMFDIVCQRASELEFPIDSYRSENGPCLIGVLISDENYKPEIETLSVRCSSIQELVKASGFDIHYYDSDFLNRIQYANDQIAPDGEPSGFKHRLYTALEKISHDFDLKIPDTYRY